MRSTTKTNLTSTRPRLKTARCSFHGGMRYKVVLNESWPIFVTNCIIARNLVVVSHSQGTMIAIESLNDPELSWLNNCFSSVTLVTMGSPLKHLYQHYFQHVYPRLNQPFWSQLRKQTDRWVNIYRIDDYVGRELDFPEAFQTPHFDRCANAGKIQYGNFMVGPRGHQGYWEDIEVLNIMRQEVFANARDN